MSLELGYSSLTGFTKLTSRNSSHCPYKASPPWCKQAPSLPVVLHKHIVLTQVLPIQQQARTIRARKQIVVSGGTLSSPLILQRSGIGHPKKLEKAGVKCIVDLPGVGLNFQDHYLTFSVFRAKPGKLWLSVTLVIITLAITTLAVMYMC